MSNDDQRDPSDGVIDVAVVGGGLAGLLAAVTASNSAGVGRVVLFDGHRLGGRARVDDVGGFRFNRGPRALYLDGPADRILTGLGLATRTGGPPTLRGAAAVLDGRVHLLPQGPGSVLRTSLFSPREKLGFAVLYARLMRTHPADLIGQSLADWLDGIGAHGSPRQLVEALVRVATYAHAPELVDAGAAVANAKAGIEPGVRYLDRGWQVFVDDLWTLASKAGVEHVPVAVQAVDGDDTPGSTDQVVRTSAGDQRARAVVVAAGGPEVAGRLLGGRPASWPSLGPPVTVACLELGVRRLPPRRFVLGIDEPLYLSTHAPPADLAPGGHAVVHLQRYHHPDGDPSATDQHERLRGLAAQAGIADDDIVQERFLASMTVSQALAVATAGGVAGRVPVGVSERPGVFVAGDWVGPEGLLLDGVAASAVAAGEGAARAVARSATMTAA